MATSHPPVGSHERSAASPLAREAHGEAHAVRLLRVATLASLVLASSCKSPETASFVDRVWISAKPADAKADFAAILVSGRQGARQLTGVLHRGSAYRGRWDTFSWTRRGDAGARMVFYQDGRTHDLQLIRCEAPEGFDLCMQVEGDPSGVRRWLSKKRWTLRRKARAGAALDAELLATLAADEDADFAFSPED